MKGLYQFWDMMTNHNSGSKQTFSKKLSRITVVASVLLLLLPCYSWFLFRSYQITIEIPREWGQFEEREKQIIQALRDFKTSNHYYPEHLTALVPHYLDSIVWESDGGSFHYGVYEDGEFFLSANVPKSWFGWPTRRSCRSQDELTECNFQFICGYMQGVEILTEPIGQEQPTRQFLRRPQTNPCSNQD